MDQALADKLAEARGRFAARCRAEAEDVAAWAGRLAFETAALDRLAATAHRLHGAAGSYGYPEVAEHAREVEVACTDHSEDAAAKANALAAMLREVAA